MHLLSLIFFIYPDPNLAPPKRLPSIAKGLTTARREGEVGAKNQDQLCQRARRSQNQFTPPGDEVNKLIFK